MQAGQPNVQKKQIMESQKQPYAIPPQNQFLENKKEIDLEYSQ